MSKNIVIVGNGKMGRLVYELDNNKHQKITVDPKNGNYKDLEQFRADHAGILDKFTAIDFSSPAVVMNNIYWYAYNGVDAVIGTTGWANDSKKLDMVQDWVNEGNIGLVYSANFSDSVQMMFVANRVLAAMADMMSGWDVAVNEVHHNEKLDVSGTAKALAYDIIKGQRMGKREIADNVSGGKSSKSITISSDRLQGVFGEHTVSYAHEDGDRIDLFHHANSREGFAIGALKAAEFISGKQGLYDYSEIVQQQFLDAIKKEFGDR